MLAVFPLTVLSAMVNVPPLKIPPPSPALLPLIVQLFTVTLALFSLSIPPPVVPAWPFLIRLLQDPDVRAGDLELAVRSGTPGLPCCRRPLAR